MDDQTGGTKTSERGASGGLPYLTTRREFLRTGGAIATAALGGTFVMQSGVESLAKGQAKANRADGFQRKGMSYFYPGFFEYSLGPWQASLPPNPDLVGLWKQTIDWYADHGLNFVVLQLGPYGREMVPIGADRVRFGWGYHYVLNFDKFPEARCTTENAGRFHSDAKPFKPDEIKRNQDIVRAITEYGAEKGVDVFQHHYNFLAPTVFVDAHPELTRLEYLRKGNFTKMDLQCWDDRRLLYYDICWNQPLHRKFLTACFEEYFQLFPASAGILITPGERARCQCIHCIGEQPSEAAAMTARYTDSPEKRVTLTHFIKSFVETLRGMGKDPLVRNWIAGVNAGWTECLPKGVPYATKYSVFDLIQGGPDPEIDPWIEAGHTMWHMKEITGNENSGQALNIVPSIYDDIAKKSLEKGVRNIIGIVNVEGGFQYRRYRVQGLHETLFANAVGKREGTGQQVAERYFEGIFGSKGPQILKAAEQYSQVPFHLSRIIGSDIEGSSPEPGYYLAPIPGLKTGHPGVLGTPQMDPPPWMALGVANFGEYVRHLERNPWKDDFRAGITAGRIDPILFMRENTEKARAAMETLAAVEKGISESAKEELRFLQLSAHVAYLMGLEHAELLEARLYYTGAKGKSDLPVRRWLAKEALAHYEKAVEAAKARGPLLEEFVAMGVINREHAVAGFYEKGTLDKRLARELPALRKDLAGLLEDAWRDPKSASSASRPH